MYIYFEEIQFSFMIKITVGKYFAFSLCICEIHVFTITNVIFSLSVADTMLSDMDEMPTIKLGDYTLQMELEDLKPEVAEIARKELRENPDIKRDAVVELRDLLKGTNALIL